MSAGVSETLRPDGCFLEAHLVRKHQVDRLFLQDPIAGGGMNTVIQQRGNNLHIFCWFGETASPTLLEDTINLFFRLCIQRPPIQMAVKVERQTTIRSAGVHECQIPLHLIVREHVDILQAKGLENVLLEIVVEAKTRGALNQLSSPVDVDAIFPRLAGLVHQGLREVVVEGAGEFIETLRTGPVDKALVEE